MPSGILPTTLVLFDGNAEIHEPAEGAVAVIKDAFSLCNRYDPHKEDFGNVT